MGKKKRKREEPAEVKSNYKWIPRLIVVLLLIMSQARNYVNDFGNEGISASHPFDAAKQMEERAYEVVKEVFEEEIDKVYGDGLYKEDVRDIKAEFNELYEIHLNERFSNIKQPITMQIDVEFYTLTLKKARDGEMTFEEVIENPGEHIRSLSLITNGYYKPSKLLRFRSKDYYDEVKAIWHEYKKSGVKKTDIIWSIYDSSILDETDTDEITSSVHQLVYLEPYKRCLYRNIINNEGFDSHKKFLDNTQADLDLIANEVKRKYDEEFIGIIYLKDKGRTICMPVDDPSLDFESEGTTDHGVLQDKYITLLVQKRLYDHVRSVIKEVGLEDKVVPVVIPMDSDDSISLARKVDKPSSLEPFELVNGYFDDDTCITLHYMLLPGEVIDYEKIRTFYNLVREPFKTRVNGLGADGKPFEYKETSIFVYFYDVESIDMQNMILNASKHDYFTEHYIDNGKSLSTFWASLYETLDVSDGCIAVMVKGIKQDKIAAMNRFGYEGSSIERFIEFVMVDSVFD